MSETAVFFGSGPVAAKSLGLISQSFSIEAVITKPRPQNHKGPVPVIESAESLGIPISTVDSKDALRQLFAPRPFSSKLAILIDFGIIIPQPVIDYFALGIVNSHFSLLPKWRGADPITFTILNGDEQTGVSLMLLTAGLDEGPLIAQSPLHVPAGATTPSLTADLTELSYEMLAMILPKYVDGSIAPHPQSASVQPTYSRKLSKDDGLIAWDKPARDIEREVRAFAGWPQSRARLGDVDVVITKAHTADATTEKAGDIIVTGHELAVSCGEGMLVIDKLKPAGKPEMTSESFLAGYRKRINK